ncbi:MULTISPECIES: flagellar hook protein FlgE [Rheinheimera]|jgi:flagellar hook protein FlgE|uniref:Flagellar hook protein FlgE n=2 Tax=Rheinheimera aquimaris TaxID=412437 RepID=A0ABN1D950_9GAMM|nr:MULTISPECIES: flagellar hook protein FlgE [Rheinheimera]MCB5212680.1 flagellar hook protein FlgE [Rheinheimera aquimaris]MCD1600444.1 flagellar hook protein FlgE [Rheinheimera aquimaris]HBN89399.1 flagellar hook protein FlgE [Rheinheimera sp.]|tara:strand:- start:3893 stop:5194 length:1302 start_codon:yes stop_codon:yes gene_type:complete
MSFNIALSGLAAAQKDLDTTANNIANVNTTGFKESRAEFADVYATSIFASGRTKVGDGVTTAVVAQQFSQGSLQFTNNSLDLAITGEGFFALTPDIQSQDMTYTRAGAFKLNKDNFIVDNKGNFLQGFAVDPVTGENQSVSLSTTQPISIPTSAGAPRATNNIFLSMNLDSRELATDGVPFDATDRATYNHSTSVTVYDSLGESHTVTTYFRKTTTVPPANAEWESFVVWDDVTGSPLPGDNLVFDASGNFVTPPVPTITLPAATLNNPANGYLTNGAQFAADVVVNFRDASGVKQPTQYASTFDVNNLSQDGTTVGYLTGVDIDAFGRVLASYSNGDSAYLAQVAMVRFANVQGLKQVGNTSWKQSITSGEPIGGQANTGTFGAVNASSLEQSNVNLTTELVDLISAQRNFQANSRALEVNSTLQQTVLQIR